MAKTFNKINPEDFIYRINPFTEKIEGQRVQDIMGVYDQLIRGKHTSPEQFKHWVMITVYYRETLVHSADLEKTPTFKLLVDGRREIQLGMTKIEGQELLIPVPFSPSEETLKSYQQPYEPKRRGRG